MTETLTLEYKLRTFNTKSGRDKKSKCEIYLDGVSLGLVNSAIHDGARVLLKMGYSPHTLLTTRSQDSVHASWVPQPLHKWAKWTTEEQDDRAVRLKSFREWERVSIPEASSPFQVSPYLNSTEGLKSPQFGGVL